MFSSLSQGWLKKYHGVQGGVLLRGAWAQKLAANNPTFAKMNNGPSQARDQHTAQQDIRPRASGGLLFRRRGPFELCS
jgi:hypothetical protein